MLFKDDHVYFIFYKYKNCKTTWISHQIKRKKAGNIRVVLHTFFFVFINSPRIAIYLFFSQINKNFLFKVLSSHFPFLFFLLFYSQYFLNLKFFFFHLSVSLLSFILCIHHFVNKIHIEIDYN